MRLSKESVVAIVEKITEGNVPDYLKSHFKKVCEEYLSTLEFNQVNLKPFPPGLRDFVLVLENKNEAK